MDGISVEGIVTKKSEPKMVDTRFGQALYAQATLEDETGEIRLNLWRDQVEKVNVGSIVRVENGFTKFRELNVGSRGEITVRE